MVPHIYIRTYACLVGIVGGGGVVEGRHAQVDSGGRQMREGS